MKWTLNQKKAAMFAVFTLGGMGLGYVSKSDVIGPIEGAVLGMVAAAIVNAQLDAWELPAVAQED